ncbi:MAG: hypothetical protein HQ506_07170 [Candidatus Marinimicrobia bacterium]|nr:hypothetical protein [Candidatus Neomarinimicrobiota bacterium]
MMTTEAEGWTYLAIADVPLDSIPDKILTKYEVIEAAILGFLPETLTTEAKLMYISDKSGRTIIIPLSEIVRMYDGKTRRNIALPVHAYFGNQSNFVDKHSGAVQFVTGFAKGFAKGFFVTYGVGLVSLLFIFGQWLYRY